eukprot:CAMPEP_0168317150 /NCGR_PEP_ID=MMETSP0210-20121227/22961_1 /TAXON_ID=40633 /ORGANISM="Condylostoma magnum, Strain COL2" /LENGTH=41 /DNA_ID= /DNA_START= /DNA_END= /DNA_ORIENTATION=
MTMLTIIKMMTPPIINPNPTFLFSPPLPLESSSSSSSSFYV